MFEERIVGLSCFSVVTINIPVVTRRMLVHVISVMFLIGCWLHHRSTELKTKNVLGLGVSLGGHRMANGTFPGLNMIV